MNCRWSSVRLVAVRLVLRMLNYEIWWRGEFQSINAVIIQYLLNNVDCCLVPAGDELSNYYYPGRQQTQDISALQHQISPSLHSSIKSNSYSYPRGGGDENICDTSQHDQTHISIFGLLTTPQSGSASDADPRWPKLKSLSSSRLLPGTQKHRPHNCEVFADSLQQTRSRPSHRAQDGSAKVSLESATLFWPSQLPYS